LQGPCQTLSPREIKDLGFYAAWPSLIFGELCQDAADLAEYQPFAIEQVKKARSRANVF
jgi:hypothetical protein